MGRAIENAAMTRLANTKPGVLPSLFANDKIISYMGDDFFKCSFCSFYFVSHTDRRSHEKERHTVNGLDKFAPYSGWRLEHQEIQREHADVCHEHEGLVISIMKSIRSSTPVCCGDDEQGGDSRADLIDNSDTDGAVDEDVEYIDVQHHTDCAHLPEDRTWTDINFWHRQPGLMIKDEV